NHRKTSETSSAHAKRLCTPHPRRTPPQPHLRPPETPALATHQQKDHLQAPHPRTQSPPQQGPRIPQPSPHLLHAYPSTSLHQPRSRRRPSYPPNQRRGKILLLPGSQDVEFPPCPPQDHPGPPCLPEASQDLALRTAVTPPERLETLT
ncbi:hypothetical protein NDU88_005492, partial [Pleurodeles waltl]